MVTNISCAVVPIRDHVFFEQTELKRRHKAPILSSPQSPSQDDLVLVLGGVMLARGAADIADQLFGWYPPGRG